MFLSYLQVKEETLWVSKEIKKYMELIENENTKYQNLWKAAKAVLRSKLIAVNVHIIKEGKNLNPHSQLSPQEPGQREINSKQTEEIIKAEIHEISSRKPIEEVNEIVIL